MTETQARRIVWPRPGEVAVESFTCPPPGEDQVLVEALVSLISPGTERAFFLTHPNTRLDFPAPAVGYSLIGRIIAKGAAVPDFAVGDIVATNARHVSHALVEAPRLLKVPDGLPVKQAVFFNLLAIALQGIRKADVELGEAAGVIGLGLIGQFALQFARLSGAFPAIGVDMIKSRRALCRDCGADLVINPEAEDLAGAIARSTDGRGLDVIVECTGRPEPIVEAFALLARRGRLVLLGSPRGNTRAVNFYPQIHVRGISIIGAHADVRPSRGHCLNF